MATWIKTLNLSISISKWLLYNIWLHLSSIDAMNHNLTRLNITFSTSFQTIMPRLEHSNDMRISTEDPYRLAVSRDTGKMQHDKIVFALKISKNSIWLIIFIFKIIFLEITKNDNTGDVAYHRYLVLTVDDISNVRSDRNDLYCMVVAVYGMVICKLFLTWSYDMT